MLIQPEFPAHRRRDPLCLVELQTHNEFMNNDRAVRVLYEVKTSRDVPEPDFAVLIEDVASTASPAASSSGAPTSDR